jgi:hydrogenase maturation protein HypF
MLNALSAKQLNVNGVVQGVGFRPHVFQLARRHRLNGDVSNTSSGVRIHIEGLPEHLDAFEAELVQKSPPLAVIVDVSTVSVPPRHCQDFRIVKSSGDAAVSTLISPDVSVCRDCLAELFDPDDRRYRYPFINCTNCGPRYTIIDDIPYDRPKTSMRSFKMCPQCQAEYDDPGDRRFHAQPNACPDCGPRVKLLDRHGREVKTGDPVGKSAELLQDGVVLAVKGLGGYHLAVDAENDAAVNALRARKLREEKPLALMCADMNGVRRLAEVTAAEENLLNSIQRPIVLLSKKRPTPLSAAVAPGNKYFGIMLPYTPLHYLLLDHGFAALVMTSGNLSEEPIAIENGDALSRLANIADYFLVHDRDIYLRSDDSIVIRGAGDTRFLRRSRGYVPIPVFLKHDLPAVTAVGAELKNTVCLTKGDKAFLSQHVGDLENLSTYDFFQLTLNHLGRILDIAPDLIAHDLHPDYMSTRYAREQTALPTVAVQHHHAHIVSCMAEHKLDGPVIGLSFDGTGLGTDGRIWGGEVLLADPGRFDRAAHLAYVPMPGGAAAIKEPWRMAVSYLHHAYGDAFIDLDIPGLEAIGPGRLSAIAEIAAKGINSPLTSSLGRLFDGVAAILGLHNRVSFEGQAAMALEMLATDTASEVYDHQWEPGADYRIDPAPLIRALVSDLKTGTATAQISANFHATLIELFSLVCSAIRKEFDLNRVVLSGGCFQNITLLSGLLLALLQQKFEVYAHRLVPTNDGGIALGQAVVAANQMD